MMSTQSCKKVAIVQARMNSSRLPGKVLMDLAGKPMLEQQLRRLKCAQELDDIVVATTSNPEDQAIVDLADRLGLRWYRGSEHDVLSRYVEASREAKADLVVRLTADCPLIDPAITDRVVRELTSGGVATDYASNTMVRTFPRGLDTEALYMDVLVRTSRLAGSIPAREHVTYFIHSERPDLYILRSVVDEDDHSGLRWTVDTPEDLQLVRAIYTALDLADRDCTYAEVLDYVRAHPTLQAINAHVEQKAC